MVGEYVWSFQFHLAVDDGKKENWLREEFLFWMVVDEDFNVIQLFLFFHWCLMNIYNCFNSIWQLMMARREIGWERISISANLSERPNDHRGHHLKINPFTLLLNCSIIYSIFIIYLYIFCILYWTSGQMTLGATIWKSIHLLFL